MNIRELWIKTKIIIYIVLYTAAISAASIVFYTDTLSPPEQASPAFTMGDDGVTFHAYWDGKSTHTILAWQRCNAVDCFWIDESGRWGIYERGPRMPWVTEQ